MPPSIEEYCLRITHITVGPSTLRNQGAPGVAAVVRGFLAGLDLRPFGTGNSKQFARSLDLETSRLVRVLPERAGHWGTARKALNLFLGEAYYRRFVCAAYGLDKAERLFELPLDSQVGQYLAWQSKAANQVLPAWRGIRRLTPSVNAAYQQFALALAEARGTGWSRIHLDVVIWRRL